MEKDNKKTEQEILELAFFIPSLVEKKEWGELLQDVSRLQFLVRGLVLDNMENKIERFQIPLKNK